MSRRATAVLLGAVMALHSAVAEPPQPPPKDSTIHYAMRESSLAPGGNARATVVRAMVDELVQAVTGIRPASAAWASLVGPNDRVGIKVSTAAGAVAGTKPEVAEAVAAGLASAGVKRSNIIVWDRERENLAVAGYKERSPLYRLAWTMPGKKYDGKAIVTAPVVGRLIWGDLAFGDPSRTRKEDLLSSGEQLSSTSHYAKILSRDVDKVVNIPSLTDSFLTGVNGAVANMTLPNVDNWRRFAGPPSHGDPHLAELYLDEMIRGKVVLTILDALILQYAGGPFPGPAYSVPYHTLFASTDPVAIDATARRLLDDYRLPAKLPSLEETTRWLESAHILGLGNFEEDRIKLVAVPGGSAPTPTLTPPPRGDNDRKP
jgi:uncharacterized protein (DUF362 family)